MSEPQRNATPPRFDWLAEYQYIEQLLAQGRAREIGPYLKAAAEKYAGSRYLHILLGMVCGRMNAPLDAVKSFEAAVNMTSPEQLPDVQSPATAIYVRTQSALAPEDCPCTRRARENFQTNLDALQALDPDLAGELAGVPDDAAFRFIDLWGRIHLFNVATGKVVVISQSFITEITPWLNRWAPLGFSSVISGQELPYILENQSRDFTHGQKRIIYLMEPDLTFLRFQLHLYDLSRFLAPGELVVFSGRNINRRIEDFFGTYRYAPPVTVMGDMEKIKAPLARIDTVLDPSELKRQAEAYYRSQDFAARLRQIAAGEILPRILVYTCRWTTFLKYCARDYEKAFAKLGCVTRMIIEENDLESLTPGVTWKSLVEFKPDFLFGVSHARPSFQIPWELPHVSFIQDRCGPILTLDSLQPYINPHDVLLCLSSRFEDYLAGKGVPREQMAIMPVPADEEVFFPLPEDDPLRGPFACDVAYVKHGHADPDRAMAELQESMAPLAGTPYFDRLTEFLAALSRRYRQDPRAPWQEEEIFDDARRKIGACVPEGHWMNVENFLVAFQIQVLSANLRLYCLSALANAGIDFRLYGNHWREDPRFSAYARGPLLRGPDLNGVYNFSQINLHMNLGGTMHQRLCEGALAGGFFLVSNLDPANDWSPASAYFAPDKEMVVYTSDRDLVDKCRFYLAHPAERRAIARNMRQRALAERTCLRSAEQTLALFRERIRRCGR